MKELSKTLLVILLSGTCSLATQNSKQSSGATAGATTSANAQAQANKSRTLSLDSGTQIDAEITSALDLKKAKPGDSFKMKTLKAVKKDGKEIISRGSTISSTANKTLASTTGSTGAVGSNVGGLTRGPIQIVNDTTSSAASGSTLTMASGNAKLESGTQFMLHTTSALTLTQQLKNN